MILAVYGIRATDKDYEKYAEVLPVAYLRRLQFEAYILGLGVSFSMRGLKPPFPALGEQQTNNAMQQRQQMLPPDPSKLPPITGQIEYTRSGKPFTRVSPETLLKTVSSSRIPTE